MNAGTFSLTIELGNEAMRRERHVADALAETARRFFDSPAFLEVGASGSIRDANGNTVGSWEVTGDV